MHKRVYESSKSLEKWRISCEEVHLSIEFVILLFVVYNYTLKLISKTKRSRNDWLYSRHLNVSLFSFCFWKSLSFMIKKNCIHFNEKRIQNCFHIDMFTLCWHSQKWVYRLIEISAISFISKQNFSDRNKIKDKKWQFLRPMKLVLLTLCQTLIVS